MLHTALIARRIKALIAYLISSTRSRLIGFPNRRDCPLVHFSCNQSRSQDDGHDDHDLREPFLANQFPHT